MTPPDRGVGSMRKLLAAVLLLPALAFSAAAQGTDVSKARRIDLTDRINDLKANPPKQDGLKQVGSSASGLKIFAVIKEGSIVGWEVQDRKGKKLQVTEAAIPLTKTAKPRSTRPVVGGIRAPAPAPREQKPKPDEPKEEEKEKLICVDGEQVCFVIGREKKG
jgi:hypothetical protein